MIRSEMVEMIDDDNGNWPFLYSSNSGGLSLVVSSLDTMIKRWEFFSYLLVKHCLSVFPGHGYFNEETGPMLR